MLKRLSYNVVFSATGRALGGALSFEEGITAITGPNESGKSLIIEMARFCLFGSSALRGKRDDYSQLSAKLDVMIRGEDYQIERTLSNAKVLRAGEPIAVGTSPVNKKVQQLLGFDLNVFDVACSANQSEVTRLGDMGPTDRKKLVDQTIGLDRLDEIQKWASEQRLLMGREVEVLKQNLGPVPVAPGVPFNYEPSEQLAKRVEELRASKTKLDLARGWLQHTKSEPVAPVAPAVTATDEELAQIDDVAAQARLIRAQPVVDFDVEEVRAQWVAYELWGEKQSFSYVHPRPTMTQEELDAERIRLRLQGEVTELLERQARLAQGEADCPECGAHFKLEHAALAGVAARLAEIGEIDRTPVDAARLAREALRLQNWASEETQAAWERLKDVPEAVKPAIDRRQLIDGGITTAERDRRLAALPVVRERRVVVAELDAQRAFAAAEIQYARQLGEWRAWLLEREAKKALVSELQPLVDALPGVEALLAEAERYERESAAYTAARATYEAKVEEIEKKTFEHDGWKQVAAFLNEIRTRIKTYLVPSLSRVASHLLAQMTGGQRSSIVVDEDFNIAVDGQRLETLSGSGKACANLALRIGLGQVLTNNVLSIFIGDEIDASMDEERAEFTQNSLGSLTSVISQILIVTHKIPSVDKIIRLEG